MTLRTERRGGWVWRMRGEALPPIDGEAEAIKPDAAIDVLRIGDFVVKHYKRGKWYSPIGDLLRGSRARRTFDGGLALERAGVATARVEAYGERYAMGLPVESKCVMAYVPGEPLYEMLLAGRADDHLERVAELVAKLHDAGFSHRDLKAPNFLVHGDDVTLVDLDGMRHVGRVPRDVRMSNLDRLRRDVGEALWPRVMARYDEAVAR